MQTYNVKVGNSYREYKAQNIDNLRKRLIQDFKDGYFVHLVIGDKSILEIQHGGYALWYPHVTPKTVGTVYEVRADGSLGRRIG